MGCQWNRVAKMIGAAGGHESGGGVEQHDIAAGRFFTGEHFANQLGIQSRISAGDVVKRGALQAEFFRRNFVAANLPVAHFGDSGCGGDGDFVEAVASVNDESAAQTQHAESLGEFLYEVGGIDSDHLAGGARGIGQRT